MWCGTLQIKLPTGQGGETKWMPMPPWNSYYPGPSQSQWSGWYPYSEGKAKATSEGAGGKGGGRNVVAAFQHQFPPIGAMHQGPAEWKNEWAYNPSDWPVHAEGHMAVVRPAPTRNQDNTDEDNFKQVTVTNDTSATSTPMFLKNPCMLQ